MLGVIGVVSWVIFAMGSEDALEEDVVYASALFEDGTTISIVGVSLKEIAIGEPQRKSKTTLIRMLQRIGGGAINSSSTGGFGLNVTRWSNGNNRLIGALITEQSHDEKALAVKIEAKDANGSPLPSDFSWDGSGWKEIIRNGSQLAHRDVTPMKLHRFLASMSRTAVVVGSPCEARCSRTRRAP